MPNQRPSTFKGKWRIVEMSAWTKDYLDLVAPAFIEFDGEGGGDMAFGALEATIHRGSAAGAIAFDWIGCDEGDEVRGTGYAELRPDGSLAGELDFDSGDDSRFRAISW
jgi:hypothetical protein